MAEKRLVLTIYNSQEKHYLATLGLILTSNITTKLMWISFNWNSIHNKLRYNKHNKLCHNFLIKKNLYNIVNQILWWVYLQEAVSTA